MIIHCGDSFTLGIGCKPEYSYASLINQRFEVPLFNLGKNGSSHFTIYLQVEYALYLNPKLVIINTTGIDRLDWIKGDLPSPRRLRLTDVDYHSYNVDGECFYNKPSAIISRNPDYNPILFSEPVNGVDEYLHGRASPRLQSEPKIKLKLMVDYHGAFSEPAINGVVANGLLVLMARKLELAGINYVILSSSPELLKLLPEKNVLNIDLAGMAKQMPDSKGTGHISEIGHILAADTIQTHIIKHNLY